MGNIEFQGKQKVCRWESTVRKGKKDKQWAWLYFLRQTPCWFLPQMSCEELPGATSGAVAEDRKEGWGVVAGSSLTARPCPPTPHPPQCPVLALSHSATAFSRHLHYSKINALSILFLHTLDMCAAPLPVLPRVSHPCCPQDMLQMKSNGYC